MKSNWTEKLLEKLPKIQKILAIFGALFFFSFGVYRGITTNFGVYTGILIGILGAASIMGSYSVVGIWDVATTSLSDFLDKYPKFRRRVLIFFSIFILVTAFIIVIYSDIDILFKFGLFLLFLILLPSVLYSFIREDRRRESFKVLGNQITPELIAQNPQAAIEHAFTIFEDRLRSRLGVGSSVFGEGLINEAFGQNGKLSYSDVEGENKGARNLMAGAYATYRNPRKHRLVKDDKETALAIIALIELLIHIVEDSSEKEALQ